VPAASIVSVRVEAPALAHLVAQMNKTQKGKELRKDMAKSLRKSADKVVKAEKAAVMGLSSKAKHTKKQTARYAATELGRRKKISDARMAQAIQGAGLRRSIANSIERIIRYQGADVGVRVRARASKMPPGMSKLPKLTNKGSWTHPYLGHRDIIVKQTTSPAGWWSKTGEQHYPEIRAEMELVLKAYAAKLARLNGGF